MLEFIMDHLLIIIISFIVLFVILPFIINSVKTIITVVVVIAILGALGVFGPKFFENVKEPISVTKDFAKTTIQPIIEKELKNAQFNYEPKTKKYVIQSTSFKLEGIADNNKADVHYKGKKYTIDVTFLKTFIESKIEQQNQTK